MFGLLEIALIVVAMLVLFGGTRLPKLSQGIGRSIKYFKYGLRGDDEIKVTPRSPDSDSDERDQTG